MFTKGNNSYTSISEKYNIKLIKDTTKINLPFYGKGLNSCVFYSISHFTSNKYNTKYLISPASVSGFSVQIHQASAHNNMAGKIFLYNTGPENNNTIIIIGPNYLHYIKKYNKQLYNLGFHTYYYLNDLFTL